MARRLFDLSDFDHEEIRHILGDVLGLTEGIDYQCEKRFGDFGRNRYERIIVSTDHTAVLIRIYLHVTPITI